MNGRPLIDEPLEKRFGVLNEAVKQGAAYRISETVDDGEALFQAILELGMEGIMAKKKTSRYSPGKRTNYWQKIKIRKTADCIIIGYTEGKGDRSDYFGALHVAERIDKNYIYRGKVGTGFSITSMKEMYSLLTKLDEVNKPDYAPPSRDTVWISPKLIADISYSGLTAANVFRDPVYHRLRLDKFVKI